MKPGEAMKGGGEIKRGGRGEGRALDGRVVFAFLVILALVLSLFSGFVLRRAFAAFEEGQAVRRHRQELESRFRGVESLEKDLARQKEAIASARRALLRSREPSEALRLLTESARAKGLLLSDLTALEPVPREEGRELPLALKLSGRFPDLLRFLFDMEGETLVLRVRKMEVEAPAPHRPQVRADLEVSVFSAGREPSAGSEAVP